MTRDEALKILDLGHALPAPTPEMIRARFAAKVKEHHPDTQTSTMQTYLRRNQFADAPPSLAGFKKARDVLLQAAGEARAGACPVCRGSGWVSTGFKQERCVRGC